VGDMFTLGGNVTLIDAKVKRNKVFERFGTFLPSLADTRSLFDQPERIANAYATFDFRPADLSMTVSYFKISNILRTVNRDLPDTFVAGYDRWDFTLSKRFGTAWQLRLSARNLRDPERKLIADPEATGGFDLVYRSYKDGRSYTLSTVYEF